MEYGKCNLCGKVYTIESYDLETEDIADGFVWEVVHKEEFCNKLNLS